MLVNSKGDAQHFAREDYRGRRRAESLGELNLIVGLPHLGSSGRSRAVEQNAPLLGGTAFTQSAPAVFLTGVLGPRIQATGGDHRIAVGIGHSREVMPQAGAAQGAEARYRGNVFSRFSCSRH